MEVLENHDQWLAHFRESWLAHLEATGEIDWERYPFPKNQSAPAGPGVDLSESRLMLVSSSGAYLPDAQEPFDAASPHGDYSVRLVATETPLEALAYAHDHYDQTAVHEDPQVLLPLTLLRSLVEEGVIGELAPSLVSFMGYQPNAARVADETTSVVVAAAQNQEVDAALLVPA
jgi:glycine/betaine/sarcosine/D-proline reductase family selenoprotein B